MKKILLLTTLAISLLACKSAPQTTENPPAPKEPAAASVQEEPKVQVQEEPAEPEPQPEKTDNFTVSEEKYNQTFDEIEELIKELTQLIRKKNFNGWKNFLSEKYIEKVGSADYLKEISNSPSLKNAVELKTLRDYFQWVVVPSRASAKLDKIVFKDDTHVTAYMYIDKNPTILFQFEYINDHWTVSIW